MLAQKREDGSLSTGPSIRLNVSHGYSQHEITIPAQATFGDLKKAVAHETGLEPHEQTLLFRGKEKDDHEYLHMVGIKDMSRLILLEDPASKEPKLGITRRDEGMSKACEAVSHVRSEVDELSEKVSILEKSVRSGRNVSDKEFVVLTELFMKQLLKLDSIEAEGEAKVQRKNEKKILSWGTGVLSCEFLHMRCIAHIINLVVHDGLKDINKSVSWIRKAVKYIRQSPGRLQSFKKCAEECNVSSKASLCLDVATRWNSTFKMLSIAKQYEGVFELYETQDPNFRHEVEFEPDIENESNHVFIDWVAIKKMSKMLQHFYDTTMRVSGSSYITSNTFWTEISDLLGLILKWSESDDLEIKSMGMRMKTKFDKYWGDHNKMNKLIFIATVFDPREKFEIMKFAFCKLYGTQNGEELFKGVTKALCDLFDEYKGTVQCKNACISQYDGESSNSYVQTISNNAGTKRKSIGVFKEEYLKQKLKIEGAKKITELDTYLNEALVEDHEDFDILRWWRLNSERFPILSHIARDILSVPISTVASESAFSTGGRVLDAFRSSLTPKMAEILICSQDWLRGDNSFNVDEELEDYENTENGPREKVGSSYDLEANSTNINPLDAIQLDED